MQDCPEAKKPCKGILKTSSSFDKPGASSRKSAKFDELNVLQTYHPIDKDYGHMKIEEPKTPYNYVEVDAEHKDQLDAELLAEKLRIAANTQPPTYEDDDDDLSDIDSPETDEEKMRRLEFERRRKAHYNEYEAVRLARKLIEEELEDDDENEENEGGKSNSDSQPSQETRSEKPGSSSSTQRAQQDALVERRSVVAGEAGQTVATTGPMEIDSQMDPTHPSYKRTRDV